MITSPTNLYSQEQFPSLDYTISFHIDLVARVMSRSKSGVEPVEELLLAVAWRKWQQAAEALDEAEKPDDFQAVGMRCRESLVAMVRKLAKAEMVPSGTPPPKRSDVGGWTEMIANHVAHGGSAKGVRCYMKTVAKSGWDLVNWLTHAAAAAKADAILARQATVLLTATAAALYEPEIAAAEAFLQSQGGEPCNQGTSRCSRTQRCTTLSGSRRSRRRQIPTAGVGGHVHARAVGLRHYAGIAGNYDAGAR